MSDDRPHHIGLTKRELEREVAWMMRHIPADPMALAKLLAQVITTIIDKNNAALAKREAHHDEHPKAGTP